MSVCTTSVCCRRHTLPVPSFFFRQVREDVTRFRYGDEQHLDEALTRIFRCVYYWSLLECPGRLQCSGWWVEVGRVSGGQHLDEALTRIFRWEVLLVGRCSRFCTLLG